MPDWGWARAGGADLRPLSPNEERYLLAETVSGLRYCSPWLLEMRGPLVVERLEAAIRGTCARHEARRTGFRPLRNGGFRRIIHARPDMVLARRVMHGATDDEVRELARQYCYTETAFTPRSLNRFLLVELGPEHHQFVFGLHHALTDGETYSLFIREVFDRYNGRADFPPGRSYAELWDWDWKSSQDYEESLLYWRERLSHVAALHGLPEDRAAPPGLCADSLIVGFGDDLTTRIDQAAQELGASSFAFVTAVYCVLLARLTDQRQVCTTFQGGGRRGLEGSEGVHGVFSNALTIAVEVEDAAAFDKLCLEVKDQIRQATVHALAPYHHVVRATGVRSTFAINSFPILPQLEAPGLEVSIPDVSISQDDFDLNVRLVRKPAGLEMVLFYRGGAYSAERIRGIGELMVDLADAFARDAHRTIRSASSGPLPAPDVLPAAKSSSETPDASFIYSAFLRRAEEAPKSIAIEEAAGPVTYAELASSSGALAEKLIQRGLRPGDRVAILAERNADLVRAMIGVSRAGGVFAVLEADQPTGRLEDLVGILRPRLLLGAAGRSVHIAERLARELHLDFTDTAPEASSAKRAASWDTGDAGAPAYVLFTSGTTDKPKAIVSSHRPLVRFAQWQAERYAIGPTDRVSFLSGLAHDPMLRDVFTTLSVGATLVIPPDEVIRAPKGLETWIVSAAPTVIHMTPPMGELLSGSARGVRAKGLRFVFWGGDFLRRSPVQKLANLAPQARQVNFYGCTETPQAVVHYELEDLDLSRIPIGHPVPLNDIRIVGESGQPRGVGELGQIVVRSDYLSLGQLVDGRIVPLAPAGGRVDETPSYPTGDLGFALPSGEIMLVGRRDDQLKIRGHRIDLAEITAVIQTHPDVSSAAVLAYGTGNEARLVAFVAGDRAPGLAPLRGYLASRTPEYMIPSEVIALRELPLLPNNKVDRQALGKLARQGPRSDADDAPRDEAEAAIVQAWSDILVHRSIGRDATYAGLGGDSLSFVQVYLATEEVLGSLPPGWQFMSIVELAKLKSRPNRWWTNLDTPILVRAVSILLVVGGHAGLVHYGGGAVAGLMLISGYMLGTLQLREAFARGNASPILRSMGNVVLPTAIISLGIAWIRWRGGMFESYVLTFTADLQDYRSLGPNYGWEGYLWYVHCLIHMMALLYLVAVALKAFGGLRRGMRPVLFWLFAIGCIGRFLLPVIVDPQVLSRGILPFDRMQYLPTTHFPTLMLGALLATCSNARERLELLVVSLGYVVATTWLFHDHRAYFLAAGVLLLLTVPRIPLPRVLVRIIFPLSGASLFIYLCQYMFPMELKHIGLPRTPLTSAAIALLGGVGLWLLWSSRAAILRLIEEGLGVRRPALEI